jgi:hypothetical protein
LQPAFVSAAGAVGVDALYVASVGLVTWYSASHSIPPLTLLDWLIIITSTIISSKVISRNRSSLPVKAQQINKHNNNTYTIYLAIIIISIAYGIHHSNIPPCTNVELQHACNKYLQVSTTVHHHQVKICTTTAYDNIQPQTIYI